MVLERGSGVSVVSSWQNYDRDHELNEKKHVVLTPSLISSSAHGLFWASETYASLIALGVGVG
jgi:hypothetical protein